MRVWLCYLEAAASRVSVRVPPPDSAPNQKSKVRDSLPRPFIKFFYPNFFYPLASSRRGSGHAFLRRGVCESDRRSLSTRGRGERTFASHRPAYVEVRASPHPGARPRHRRGPRGFQRDDNPAQVPRVRTNTETEN